MNAHKAKPKLTSRSIVSFRTVIIFTCHCYAHTYRTHNSIFVDQSGLAYAVCLSFLVSPLLYKYFIEVVTGQMTAPPKPVPLILPNDIMFNGWVHADHKSMR